MLGKILLTLAVIAAAALYIRHRGRSVKGTSRRTGSGGSRPDPWADGSASRRDGNIPASRSSGGKAHPMARATLLWSGLAVLITAGAGLYYMAWQDARTPVTVLLHGDGESPVVYRVRKRDLGDRSFTTVDGVQVTVADSERMEVIGL